MKQKRRKKAKSRRNIFAEQYKENSYADDRFPTRFPQDTVSQPNYYLNPYTMNSEYQRNLLFTGASGPHGFNFAPQVFSQYGGQFGYGFTTPQQQSFEQSCVPLPLNIYAHGQNNLPPVATNNQPSNALSTALELSESNKE